MLNTILQRADCTEKAVSLLIGNKIYPSLDTQQGDNYRGNTQEGEESLIPFKSIIKFVEYLSLYQRYFVKVIQFFTEPMLRSAYSVIHFVGLVPASTIPRDGTGWYKS